jgi:ubiquitin-protein ligase
MEPSSAASTSEQATATVDPATQHLREIKLAIEFKYMMKHAPGGVYLMPCLDDNHELHGVIFLRRGLYRNGVFRFKVNLPRAYNSFNTHPQITFTPPVFNPLVDMEVRGPNIADYIPIVKSLLQTGALDLKTEDTLREWHPEKHFLVTAMTFLKGIFYMKTFDRYSRVPNEDARALLVGDKEQYLRKVMKCVQDSMGRIYDAPPAGCLIAFTEPKPAHYALRLNIIGVDNSEGDGSRSADENSRDQFYDASNDVGLLSFLFLLAFCSYC